jgi:uncharacterized protein YkwD
MRKKVMVSIVGLSIIGMLSQIFASDGRDSVTAHLYPATLYMDGKPVTSGDHPHHFYNGKTYVPSAIEYEGTLYVPLTMIAEQLDKEVKWDPEKQAILVGKPVHTETSVPQISNLSSSAVPVNNQAVQTPQDQKEEKPSLFSISLHDSEQKVIDTLGQPDRREPSPLGYEWLIYNRDPRTYLQVGIADGKVVDLYSNAPTARVASIAIGTGYSALTRAYFLQENVKFAYNGIDVEIKNARKERPLVMVGETPVVFYIDMQRGQKVTAFRIIDRLQLIRGGFYETKWTQKNDSSLFYAPPLSIKQREKVNEALERQLLDLANVMRYRYQLPALQRMDKLSRAARSHSRDMAVNGFFQHTSPTTGLTPFERLKKAGISYTGAGENIAVGFPDSIEAHEFWMNSPTHRKNIMNKQFTHLGTGVAADYYTEDFVAHR